MIEGLQGPLQRGANDFVTLKGNAYITNRIIVLVGIHANPFVGTGELEWDQDRGTMTEFLRHRNTTRGRLEVLTMHLAEQLRKWEPDVTITKVAYRTSPGSQTVKLAVHWAHKRLRTSGVAELEVD